MVKLVRPAGRNDPAQPVFFYGQRGLGIGLGNNDNRPANRKQVVEPARDRYAGDVLAIGNQPDVRGQQKRFEIFVLDALDQSDVRKICFGLQCFSRSKPIPQPESRK